MATKRGSNPLSMGRMAKLSDEAWLAEFVSQKRGNGPLASTLETIHDIETRRAAEKQLFLLRATQTRSSPSSPSAAAPSTTRGSGSPVTITPQTPGSDSGQEGPPVPKRALVLDDSHLAPEYGRVCRSLQGQFQDTTERSERYLGIGVPPSRLYRGRSPNSDTSPTAETPSASIPQSTSPKKSQQQRSGLNTDPQPASNNSERAKSARNKHGMEDDPKKAPPRDYSKKIGLRILDDMYAMQEDWLRKRTAEKEKTKQKLQPRDPPPATTDDAESTDADTHLAISPTSSCSNLENTDRTPATAQSTKSPNANDDPVSTSPYAQKLAVPRPSFKARTQAVMAIAKMKVAQREKVKKLEDAIVTKLSESLALVQNNKNVLIDQLQDAREREANGEVEQSGDLPSARQLEIQIDNLQVIEGRLMERLERFPKPLESP